MRATKRDDPERERKKRELIHNLGLDIDVSTLPRMERASTDEPKSRLLEIMNRISEKATARGMTPEILVDILLDDGDE